jgi:major membrane immunogen (membrane-anchored lipoprotein)
MKKLLSFVLSLVFVFSLLTSGLVFAAPAKTSTKAPVVKKTYVDGTYKATYDYIDSHGWKPQISITILKDKITAVKFDYINPDKKLKSQDPAYEKAMKAVNGIGPAEYIPQLNKKLLDAQDLLKVDTITGATHSTDNFKALATVALSNAKKGNKTATVLTWDDTYTASEAAFDSHGWKGQVSLTYKDGKLTAVVFDYVDKDGKKKSEDAAYNTSMKAKSGISSKEATTKLAAGFLDTQHVDTVTGATDSTKVFKELIEKALDMRQ